MLSNLLSTKERVERLNLFSSNETIEDISTKDLRYFTIDCLIASAYSSCTDDRLSELLKAKSFYEKFLELCRFYGFKVIETRILSREEKIEQYKRGKEIRLYLEDMKQKYGELEDDSAVDDEVIREFYLKEIESKIMQSLADLEILKQEITLLKQRESIEQFPHAGSNVTNEKIRRIPAPNALLTSTGKVQQPFTILSSKQQLLQKVFTSSHRLPTMTIDDYLKQEFERGNVLSGGGHVPEKETVDEEDEEEIDRNTYKQREKDEFKDSNPRGWGNRYNRS